ncbi:MAG: P-loop NTPase [Caulobacterales bacterium]
MNKPLTELRDAILAAVESVADPVTGQGLVTAGRITGLIVSPEGGVRCVLEAPPADVERYRSTRDAAEAAVSAVPGVARVTIVLTAHATKGLGPTVRVQKGADPAPQAAQTAPRKAEGLPGIAAILAVSSAKGGVGKSTIAVNLACAFAQLGLRTGLLDIDVFGPSVPTLLGLAASKPEIGPDKKLIPLEAHGLRSMSIGYLVNIDAPMIWRGAMVTSAIRQMFDDVAWAPLDILVLDMPPGTGDAQLTIAQRAPLDGTVIVSTPQELALADVRRGIAMFEKTHVPIVGIIENMAWLEQANGEKLYIFGQGGARETAQSSGVSFLGEVPIDLALRQSADAGHPLVAQNPDHPISQRLIAMAKEALATLATGAKPPPTIRFT